MRGVKWVKVDSGKKTLCFCSISDQKKVIIVSSVCSLPILDATIASKAQIETLRQRMT